MIELLGDELETQPPGAAAVTPSLVDALLVYKVTHGCWSRAFVRHRATTQARACRSPSGRTRC
jgi:hypothetical protein